MSSSYVLGWSNGGSVAENEQVTIAVGILDLDVGSFPDSLSAIDVSGLDGTTYSVDTNTFIVYALGPLDFELHGGFDILTFTLHFADGSSGTGEALMLLVDDVPEAPDNLVLSASAVDENTADNTVVATLTGADPDGGALTYSLVSGAGFAVVGDQLVVAGALDHEATPSIDVVIAVTDAQNNTTQFTRTITIADVAEAPDGLTLSASSVDENAAAGSVVATLTGADPDGGALSYALVSGNGFSVVGNELRVSGALDHEATPTVDVVIAVTDAQNNTTQFTRTITIADVAEAPDGLTLSASSVDENAAAGTVVATLTGADPEGGALSYALVSGNGVSVVGNELRVSGALDHETTPTVDVVIAVTDAQNNTTQFTRTITIADVAEAPDGLTLSASSMDENAAVGTVVASLTGADPEGGALSYALVSGNGFSVVGNELRVSGALDQETTPTVDVVIAVTDAQNNTTQFTRSITIADVAEAPDGLTLSASSVDENAAVGTVVATLTGADPEGGALSYALVSGNGFSIVGNELRVSGALDHEAAPTVDVVIAVTDAQNNTTQFTRTITIADVPEAPDGLALSASSVDENSAVGTAVALLAGSDPDGGPLSFTLVSGSGFTIIDNELRIAGPLDHEATPTVDVMIAVTDGQNNTTQFSRAITIADVNEAPVVSAHLGITNTRISENATAGREVARVAASDPDLSDSVTLSLVGTHAALFTLDGLQVRLAEGATLDHGSAPTLSFAVRGTDGGGLFTDQAFSVTVMDVVTQGSNLQASLGGNGTTVGMTVQFGTDGAVLQLGGNAIVLSGTQTIQTADGTLAFGPDTNLAQIERLHLGLLGRSPNGDESMSLGNEFERGATMTDFAHYLLHSEAFSATVLSSTGAASVDALGNRAFAELMYQTILGRSPDSDGLDYWTNVLDSGALIRADVAVLFAGSDEAKIHYASQTQALWVVDEQAFQVRSLYDVAFDREPDAGGLQFWKSVLEGGTSIGTVADYLVTSDEFQARIDGLSTGEVLELFYQAGLERAPESDGLAYWTGVVDGGFGDWSDVLLGFALSDEQRAQLASYREGTDLFV